MSFFDKYIEPNFTKVVGIIENPILNILERTRITERTPRIFYTIYYTNILADLEKKITELRNNGGRVETIEQLQLLNVKVNLLISNDLPFMEYENRLKLLIYPLMVDELLEANIEYQYHNFLHHYKRSGGISDLVCLFRKLGPFLFLNRDFFPRKSLNKFFELYNITDLILDDLYPRYREYKTKFNNYTTFHNLSLIKDKLEELRTELRTRRPGVILKFPKWFSRLINILMTNINISMKNRISSPSLDTNPSN